MCSEMVSRSNDLTILRWSLKTCNQLDSNNDDLATRMQCRFIPSMLYDSQLSWNSTTEATMDKFIVLYKAPNAVIDEWMKKPEQERKSEETKMMDAWKKWMSTNASKVIDKGAGAGKPKVVSSSGVK